MGNTFCRGLRFRCFKKMVTTYTTFTPETSKNHRLSIFSITLPYICKQKNMYTCIYTYIYLKNSVLNAILQQATVKILSIYFFSSYGTNGCIYSCLFFQPVQMVLHPFSSSATLLLNLRHGLTLKVSADPKEHILPP